MDAVNPMIAPDHRWHSDHMLLNILIRLHRIATSLVILVGHES